MVKADEFQRQIKKATNRGLGSRFKGAKRTAVIAAALESYELSVSKGEAQAEQAAYLYQVIKECRHWKALKSDSTGKNTENRRRIIDKLERDAGVQLMAYPLIAKALQRYEEKKAAGVHRPATAMKGVYAHEGAIYQGLKAQGQFVDPAQPRYAPSATLLKEHGFGDRRGRGNRFVDGDIGFDQLSFTEYQQLDRLLEHQYKVLYMSKFQRLSQMVAIEGGKFYAMTQNSLVHMGNSTVAADLGQDASASFQTQAYACDLYGNLFVLQDNQKDSQGNRIQINHSSMLAGKDVLCAGTISIKNGRLFGISNLSGHYQPDSTALQTLLKEWQDGDGVDMSNVAIIDMAAGVNSIGNLYMKGDRRDYAQHKLFLQLKQRTA